VDTLLTLFTALFILSIVRISENNSNLNITIAGVVLALTMWVKYFGILSISFLIVSVYFKKISRPNALKVVLIGFLFFMPWILWNIVVYSFPIPFETWKGVARFAQVEVPSYAYIIFLPIVAPFTLLGYAAIRKLRGDKLKIGLTSFVIAFILVFSFPAAKEMRFIMPVTVPLSILAADFVTNLSHKFRMKVLGAYTIVTALSSFIIIRGSYFYLLLIWYYHTVFPF
jgi:hypothetical protein